MNPDRIILDAGGLEHLKTQLKEKPEIFNRLSAFKNGEIYLQMPYNAYYTNLETAYADAYFDAWVQYHDIAPKNSTSITSKRRAKSINCFWAKIVTTTSQLTCTAASKTRYIKI